MTKKDYILIARVMQNSKPQPIDESASVMLLLYRRSWNKTVENFVHELLNDNPRFDTQKFLISCHYYY